MRAQEAVFTALMAGAVGTEWGKKYDFASIKSIEDYRNRFPVQDYDSLKPWCTTVSGTALSGMKKRKKR